MKKVSRIDIMQRLVVEQAKDKPSEKVIATISKVLAKLHIQEKKEKRVAFYILLSDKNFDILFNS